MDTFNKWHRQLPTLLVAALLTACGGGGGGGDNSAPPVLTPPVTNPPATSCVVSPTGQPGATGDTAIDGFNWFNYRRADIGLTMLTCNEFLNKAAVAHSNYLRLNNTVSHDEVSGNPGFFGATVKNRIENAGYVLGSEYAYGEVISAVSDRAGFTHAEELIAAIYHRFVIFEPMFREMGTGASSNGNGYTYFTSDMATRSLSAGLGLGKAVVYPRDGQTAVPTSFDSDTESPDPVPNQNTVGYPVSVHSDITASAGGIKVTSFTIRPRGGLQMVTRLLTHANDTHTSEQSAAIIPLSTLSANTTYDVSFSGTVDGVPVTKNWSFTTK
ncbi:MULTISPECIES: CAP domain-containing protein [unclassified Duganella]|uniref:CAP domain-containing protein n=1 Tax=unclassified Duganella TaxID=2636909 RepID=UPI000A915C21|nr:MULTISPECIES: CAP domain-containing protein [unclassified Duganella]